MQFSLRPQIGTSVEDLDTPCLILDMDALDHNMATMADLASESRSIANWDPFLGLMRLEDF